MKKTIIALSLAVIMIASVAVGCSAPQTKTGLGHVISIGSSKDVSEKDGAPVDGVAQVDTVMCALTLDGSNKVLSVTFDTAQTKVTFDAAGKITADKAAELKTKRELGDAYGMKKASAIGKEWFEQMNALEKWMTGKTVDQVLAMKTKDVEGSKHADEPDLVSGVTVSVDVFLQAFADAVKNAK